jgi:WD40 repeat protein
MKQRNIGILASALTGMLVWAAVGAEPVSVPNTPGIVTATRPATTQVAPLDVNKLKFVGLLGDPRFRHVSYLTHVEVIDQGRTILSSSMDGTARLWDAGTGKELQRFAHEANVTTAKVITARMLPDGQRVVTATEKGAVRLWDVKTGKVLRTIKPEGGGERLVALSLAKDGKSIFIAETTGRVIQWDLETAQQIKEWADPGERVGCIAMSPDGQAIVFINGTNQAVLWDVTAGKERHNLGVPLARMVPPEAIRTVTFSRDGKQLAGTGDHGVWLWNAATGEENWSAGLFNSPAYVAFNPDGQTLAVHCNDAKVYLLNVVDGKTRLAIPTGMASPMDFSLDGKEVLVDNCGLLCRWDCATGKRIFPPAEVGEQVPLGDITQLALAPDGARLYSAATWPRICVWNLGQGVLEKSWSRDGDTALYVSLDGKRLLAGSDHGAAILDAATGQIVRGIGTGLGFHDHLRAHPYTWFWAPTEATVVVESEQAALELWSLADGTHRLVGGKEQSGALLAVSQDGQRAVVSSLARGSMTIWGLESEKPLGSLEIGMEGWRHTFQAVCFLPGGAGLLAINRDKQLYFWDRYRFVQGPPPGAGDLARWVKDLGADDFQVREAATMELIAAGPAGRAALDKADTNDPEVVDRVAQVRRGPIPDRQIGHPLALQMDVRALAAHPDGKHWAAILGPEYSAETVIVLGEVTPDGPKELRRFSGEGHGPCGFLFSPDGKTLYVGNGDSTISVYRAE